MDVRLSWTDCDEAGDCVMPNVLSPKDLVSRPDNMEETVLHRYARCCALLRLRIPIYQMEVLSTYPIVVC